MKTHALKALRNLGVTDRSDVDGMVTHLNFRGLAHVDKKLPGVKHFPRLTHLDLSQTCLTVGGLKQVVRNLPELTYLNLSGTCIGDQELPLVTELPELVSLDLTDTGVTGNGLRCLARCHKLRSLFLVRLGLGRLGAYNLLYLHDLEELGVSFTDILPPDLQHVACLHKLTRLYLCHVHVTGGLDPLRKLTKLRELDLSETDICHCGWDRPDTSSTVVSREDINRWELADQEVHERDLRWLADLPNLERLDFSLARLSDACLPFLRSLTHLRCLNLNGTTVSFEVSLELKRLLARGHVCHTGFNVKKDGVAVL